MRGRMSVPLTLAQLVRVRVRIVQAPGSSALGVPGRYLLLYVRSAVDPNTEVRARVNVGGVVREWSVTTGP